MNDTQKRRNAHYKNRADEPSESKGSLNIFLQLLVCMAIMAASVYFRNKTLFGGETVSEFTHYVLTHDTDLNVPVCRLRDIVNQKIGPVFLPDTGSDTVFNESTPTKASVSE